MNQRNRFDNKDSLELGENAQQLFKRLAKAKGWKVSPASRDEDINEHWDFFLEKGDKSTRIDVKSMKRIKRSDPHLQDEYTWMEIHGVRPNDNGWLYGGKADHLAFETKTGFIIVKRKDVLELLERIVDFKIQVSSPDQAKYRVYQRSGRPDKITLIETEKLMELTHAFWKK